MKKPTEEEFEKFRKHERERFGQFHSFHLDANGYCNCKVCRKVKEWLFPEKYEIRGN